MTVPASAATDAPSRLAETARIAVLGAFFVIVLLATGVFAPGLVDPAGNAFLQQGVVEGLWIVVLALSLPFARFDRLRWDRRVGLLVVFVFWAVLSSLWAGGISDMAKASVLAVNVFAVFVLVVTQKAEDVVDTLVAGLFALAAASIALVIVAPDVAVLDTWQHAGLWGGVFDQKPTLGITSAFLLYLAAMRVGARPGRGILIYHLAAMAVAAACILGSGSRGGGVLAVLAVVLGLASRHSAAIARFTASVPIIALAVTGVMMAMLAVSDRDVLTFGDFDVDFTERTFIWKHVLDWTTETSALFGSGLNGFWTRKEVADAFLGAHGWFLDNYHNGYLAIFGDCGFVGVGLFLALAVAVASVDFGRTPSEVALEKLMTGFLALFAVINVTETYLLRSTNIASILFFFFVFRLFTGERAADGDAAG